MRVESNCVSVMLPESLPEDKADESYSEGLQGTGEGMCRLYW